MRVPEALADNAPDARGEAAGARSADWREAVGAVWLDEQEWAALSPLHPLLPKPG